MSDPWLKFYPTNWRADPALRSCSMAARGLWMEMLCVMHEADPRGTLRVNGKPVGDRQLSSLAGCFEVPELLAELEAAGVFSREDDGTIYSRRMVRETAKAAQDKANGKTGGNPTLKPGVNPKAGDKAKKLEARSQRDVGAEEAPTSSEPEKPAPSVVMNLPTVTEGEVVPIFETDVEEWQVAFPGVDVRQQLAAMRSWLLANPTKRKTKKGMRRFVVSWLDKRQNAGPLAPVPRAVSPPGANGVFGASLKIIESRANGSEIFPSNHGHAERLSAEPGDKPGIAAEDLRGGIGRRVAGGHH